MKKYTKRILAFLSALALVVTTVLGNSAIRLAQAADDITPVTLDGFTAVTIKDFEKDGYQMPEGLYGDPANENPLSDYALKGGESLNKKLLNMYVEFTSGGGNERIDIAGSGAWTGFSFFASTSSHYLHIYTNYGVSNPAQGFDIDLRPAGLTKAIGVKMLVQLSIEFVDAATDSVIVGVYVNGTSCGTYTITGCNLSKFGGYIGLYRQGSACAIAVNSVGVEEPTPAKVDGFDNLTIKDFAKDGTEMAIGEYECNNPGDHNAFFAKEGDNLHKKLLSMKVKYEGGAHYNSVIFGGNGGFCGFNLHPNNNGSQLIVDKTWISGMTSAATPTLDAKIAGIPSFINNEFILQMSFEYGTPDGSNKADLTLGIYINGKLYNDQTYIIEDCDMGKVGSCLALYREKVGQSIHVDNVLFEENVPPTEPTPVQLEGFTDVTISDFVDGSGSQMQDKAYGYVAAQSEPFYLKEHTSFDKKLLSMRVKLEHASSVGEHQTRIDLGGTQDWTGLSIYSNAAGDWLYVVDNYGMTNPKMSPLEFNKDIAGVTSFRNTEFLLQISFEFGDFDNDNAADDLKLGFYMNGNLYNDQAFVINNCITNKFGNCMSLDREASSSVITLSSVGGDDTAGGDTPTEPTSIQVEGFDNITLKDFVDGDGTQMQPGEYKGDSSGAHSDYTLKDVPNFHKKLLSMKVTFQGGGHYNSIIFGGNGGWCGFNLHPNGDGTQLVLDKTWIGGMTSSETPTLTAEDAGVDSFLNDEFILQMSFEYGEVGADNKADLTLGIYIDGQLYNNQKFTIADCDMSLVGNHLALYREKTAESIFVDNVLFEEDDSDDEQPPYEGPTILEGFTNITLNDFVDGSGNQLQDDVYNVGAYTTYTLNGKDDFDKTIISMKAKFNYDMNPWETKLEFGATGDWTGLAAYITNEGALQIEYMYSDPTQPKQSNTVNFDSSLFNQEFLLELSFEYVDSDNNNSYDTIKVGVYVDGELYNNQVFTYIDIPASAFGNKMGMYCSSSNSTITLGSVGEGLPTPEPGPGPGTEPEPEKVPNGNFEKITFAHFGIKDNMYKYNGDIVAQGQYRERETLDQTVLCGNVLLDGDGSFQLIFGGKDGGWDGLRLIADGSEALYLHWFKGSEKTDLAAFYNTEAGVAFVGEAYELMVSTELIDADGDNKKNDIQFGIWFNGKLYDNQYVVVKDEGDQLGNRFAAYCGNEKATVTLNSVPELVPEPVPPKQPNPDFEKITFEYFGVADGTYKYDGTAKLALEGKATHSLDKKVLCGDVFFEGTGKNIFTVGGQGNAWYGLRFETLQNNGIALYWHDQDGVVLLEVFDPTAAEATLVGGWLNLMISTEIKDVDGDGEKDDIEVGVWFNGKLYQENYLKVIDKASGLGNLFSLYCTEVDNKISIRSIPEYVKGFDYSVYGLTKEWEKTLLGTDLKAEMAVGGSRDAEPFTGDLLAVGSACLFAVAVLVTGVYIVLQRRKES